MRLSVKLFLSSLALAALLIVVQPRAFAQNADGTVVQTAAEQLLALANQSRAESGAGRLRWDPALAAAALGSRGTVEWEALVADYDRIRDHIERVIPGFERYNARVREAGGFYLPNAPRDEREFATATGKANFNVHPIQRLALESGQLLMMTIRSHDQFNTTVYGLDDRYRGIHNERRVVLMNEEDIQSLGLKPRQTVDLISHFRGERRTARRFVVVPYPIPRRCAATYFPETNVLVPIGSVAARSNTPTSKFVIITVEPAAQG